MAKKKDNQKFSSSPQKRSEPKPPKKITASYLQNSGLYYLQRFPASRAHFQFIMMRKINRSIKHHGDPSVEDAQAMLDKVTDTFTELGYLNDQQYAIGLSRSLFRKGISPKMIEHRLKQKGLEQDIIGEALGEILPDNANMLAALQLLKRRRYGIFATHPDKKEEQKILGLLARSGFSYQTASRVMAIDMDEALDLLDTL